MLFLISSASAAMKWSDIFDSEPVPKMPDLPKQQYSPLPREPTLVEEMLEKAAITIMSPEPQPEPTPEPSPEEKTAFMWLLDYFPHSSS